jgi:DNA mismatch endonuclease (patch repair protein)
MADVVDRATRSRMMAGIRGGDTRPERAVRSFLHRNGLRFRLAVRDLPGTPDIVLPRYRSVVFVHGCFWHRHRGCRFSYTPKTRRSFWLEKFDENVARDRKAARRLRALRWRVFVVWECQVTEARLLALCKAVRGQPRRPGRPRHRRARHTSPVLMSRRATR